MPFETPVWAADADLHGAVQAVSAQKPSTQFPVAQLEPATHALPCGCSAAAQKPFTHVAPAPGHTWLHAPQLRTSVWTSTHPVLQNNWPGAQVTGTAVHEPAPLQVDWS